MDKFPVNGRSREKRKKKQRVHSLTGRIDNRVMQAAFKAVKRNRGAAGIDKVSIAMFEENLDANLASLKRDLKTRGKFVPKPLFSTCVKLFQKLDKWIRMRLRCMKFKRKVSHDNRRMQQGTFDKKLGLLKMLNFTSTTMESR